MLRIQRLEATEGVVFTLSGRIEQDDVAGLQLLLGSEASARLIFDLKNVTLAGREAIGFLERCEAGGIALRNCPMYVRELINRQRLGT
jgi:hypothetical protein